MRVIIGLGNPEIKYLKTYHNTGFRVLDNLSEKLDIWTDRKQCKALIGEGRHNGDKIVVVKPLTYMNLSGEAVLGVMNWYKCSSEDLLIVYDDIDLDKGDIRIRPSGSAGTHNGMRDIVYRLDTINIPRVRVGIGRPAGPIDLKDYVLSQPFGNDKQLMEDTERMAACVILEYIEGGIDRARQYIGKLHENRKLDT